MARIKQWDAERPWARQPCDSDRSWALFQAWLLCGLGTGRRIELDAFARSRRLSEDSIYNMAKDGWWYHRADKYDEYAAGQRFALAEQVNLQAAQVAQAGLRTAELLHQLGAPEVQRIINRAEKTPDHPGSIPPQLAVRSLVWAEKIRRDSFALMPPAPVAQEGKGLQALSDAELAELRRLHAKIDGAAA